ncbi:ATP-binding protein [Modestobacter sp. NPDC049651]|uniref:ATP-binding protein n=1 Tax=unclassified Modestobacter TaxID=2643866 RepID=UPI0033FEB001
MTAAVAVDHDCQLVDDDEGLRAAAARFLEEAATAGDVARAALPGWLVDELAPQHPDAVLIALEQATFAREPDVIAAVRRRAGELAAPRRLRLMGVVGGADARAWEERCRCEAVTNVAYAGLPVSVSCLYDRRSTPDAGLAIALATHPLLRTPGGVAANPDHQDPHAFLAARPVLEEPLQSTAPVLAVDDAPTLPGLRHRMGEALRGLAGSADAEEDFHLAVSEIAANAFRHGTRPVSARLWAAPDRLVCTITDSGSSYANPLAGYRPAHGDDLSRGGMGLWLARKLCDHVDLIATRSSFTVRLVSVLP